MKPPHLSRTLAFERWANERIDRTLAPHAGDLPVARKRFAHIIAAQNVWLARLRGKDSGTLPIWPTWDMPEISRRRADIQQALESFLLHKLDGWWTEPVQYRNQTGREFSQTPEEIITHVTMHSQYHRGQITADIRDAGGSVLATDLIAYLRELA